VIATDIYRGEQPIVYFKGNLQMYCPYIGICSVPNYNLVMLRKKYIIAMYDKGFTL
jgi:hypothetical protein